MEKVNSELRKDIKRILLVVIGSFIMALNLKTFVRAGGLLPGGFTGITLLIQEIGFQFWGLKIPYSPVNLLFNVVPVIVCFKVIGKKFTALSCLSIVLSSILTDLLPTYAIIYDTLLISIFGGIISGLAASICLSAGATAGGTDLVAIYLSDRFGFDAFNYILMGNAIILLIGGSLFGWEKALYSIIFQFTSTQMLHVCYKRYRQNTLLIVTDHPREVIEIINNCTHHGSTTVPAFGSYEDKERTMVYSVVGGDDVKKVISMIKAFDNEAFINVIKTDSIAGKFYQKPND